MRVAYGIQSPARPLKHGQFEGGMAIEETVVEDRVFVIQLCLQAPWLRS